MMSEKGTRRRQNGLTYRNRKRRDTTYYITGNSLCKRKQDRRFVRKHSECPRAIFVDCSNHAGHESIHGSEVEMRVLPRRRSMERGQ